jgi:hypothetical protein
MRRLSRLDTMGFLEVCLGLGWREMPADTPLETALLLLAEEGSIDAAAALNVLAIGRGAESEEAADKALRALFTRNEGAREELAFEGLVTLLEEAAKDMGLIPVVDPTTGETRWRQP